MMNKKKLGFSLAELLISLLIISIVLSAAIPTITKKSGASRENIWHWSDQNNSVYAGLGDNQAVLVGVDRLISIEQDDIKKDDLDDNYKTNYIFRLPDQEGETAPTLEQENWSVGDMQKMTISNKGDKLSILKRQAYSGESDFANSHISFYNTYLKQVGSSWIPEFKYSGRITMDPGNIAMGIGSLQNQIGNSSKIRGENTAIGHLSLTQNTNGYRNTALGRKTLTKNVDGSNNTAVGFASLYSLGYIPADAEHPAPRGNTAVGSLTQKSNNVGNYNTTVGFAALNKMTVGDHNTAVGTGTISELIQGDKNTAIGEWACGIIGKGSNNVCLGYGAGYEATADDDGNSDNGIYIGTPKFISEGGVLYREPSIITGNLLRHEVKKDGIDTVKDKELFINARRIAFRPFNGSAPVFNFQMFSGPGGYVNQTSDNEAGRFGIVDFNLRDIGGNKDGLEQSNTLEFSAPHPTRIAYITAYNPYEGIVSSDDSREYNDINFNNFLTFDFPKTITIFNKTDINATSNPRVAIRAEYPEVPASSGEGYNVDHKDRVKFPLLLNDIVEIRNDYNAPNSLVPINPSITFNMPFYEGFSTPNPIDFTFKAILPNGTTLIGDNAPKSNFRFGTGAESFAIYLVSSVQPAQPDPLNPTYPPNPELFSLSSKYGLTYSTEKDIRIMSKAPYNRIQLGGEDSVGEPSNFDLYIKNDDIKMNVLRGSNISSDDFSIIGGSHEGSIPDIIKQIVAKLKEHDTSISSLQSAPSDIRLKNVSGDSTAGLKEINALEVKNFTYKDDKEKTPHVGVIAQQLQKIFPNSVSKDDKGYLRIKTEEIFYAMVNSIKELCKQIQDLTAKVTGLDKRITELEKQNKMLQEQNKAFEKRLQKLERQSAKSK